MADIPKIRFKGFTEPWEQRKLGEICDSFEYGLNAAATDYDGENKYIRITDIDDNSHEFLQNNVTSPDIDFSGAENYKLKQGDILFARTGASVGKTYIYEESDGLVYYAGFLIRGRVKNEYSPEFVFQNTLTADYERFIRITSQRSGQPGVNAQEYASYQIATPVLEEQQQIGAYFSTLDHLITLHQRKCDDTKELKKYMLQKMFPKNGEKFPEIRFKGFTEAWEQRKLSDVTACIKNGYTYKADGSRDHRYKITRIESISSGVINTEKLGSSDEINENYRLVDGDILFSHINSLPYIANTALYTADLGEIYHGMNLLNIRSRHEEIDSHFLLHLLKKESTRDWFRIIAKPAVNQASISTTEVGAFAFLIPRMEEQKKISSVLDNLDNLITLHQRKCDTLKELKKYMLQNMFPKKGKGLWQN